ncbi:MAG TPA: DUF1697 domain-containing protein [Nitrospirota bacterium]|nr:DUF1697 domain-containing protein [Nitrospirota bacterium]
MPRYVAFLRAINIGGRVVKMDRLRGLFEELPYTNVETFIASGNVIFESRVKNMAGLESRIERHLADALGYEVTAFLRTAEEVAAIARYQPFQDGDVNKAGAFVVGFLKKPLDRNAGKVLTGFKSAIDDFHLHEREIYWLCKRRQSQSKFSNAAFEKALGLRSTFRGMNTIKNLAEKLGTPRDQA